MRKPAIAILGGLWCVVAFGQDLIDCIHPDVVAGLIYRSPNQERPIISSAKPEEMVGVTVPAECEWIGSSIRNFVVFNGLPTEMVIGAFRTQLSADAALERAMSALADDGWEDAQGSFGTMVSAFATQINRRRHRNACRDAEAVAVAAGQINGITYVTFEFSSGDRTPAGRLSRRAVVVVATAANATSVPTSGTLRPSAT